MTNNDFYWYWFTNIAGIGVKTQKKLLEHFGHPSTIYNAPESEINRSFYTKIRKTRNLFFSQGVTGISRKTCTVI